MTAARTAELVRNGSLVAPLEIAADRASRRQGLLGRDGIEGVFLLEPCRSVHTLRMRFPIDVAYCAGSSADGLRIIGTHTMWPGRLGLPRLRARCTLEAEAGAFARWGLAVGDRLEVR